MLHSLSLDQHMLMLHSICTNPKPAPHHHNRLTQFHPMPMSPHLQPTSPCPAHLPPTTSSQSHDHLPKPFNALQALQSLLNACHQVPGAKLGSWRSRGVYMGVQAASICRGMQQGEVAHLFNRACICVRAYNSTTGGIISFAALTTLSTMQMAGLLLLYMCSV